MKKPRGILLPHTYYGVETSDCGALLKFFAVPPKNYHSRPAASPSPVVRECGGGRQLPDRRCSEPSSRHRGWPCFPESSAAFAASMSCRCWREAKMSTPLIAPLLPVAAIFIPTKQPEACALPAGRPVGHRVTGGKVGVLAMASASRARLVGGVDLLPRRRLRVPLICATRLDAEGFGQSSCRWPPFRETHPFRAQIAVPSFQAWRP